MHVQRYLSFIGLTLALAACGGSKPPLREAPRGIGIATELIEPGAEPREVLRYRRAPGLIEDLVVQFGVASLLETPQGAAASEAPVLSLGLRLGVVSTVSEGVWSYPVAFRMLGLKMPEGADPAQAEALARTVAPLGAVSGLFDVDDRGITSRAEFVVPPEVSPRLVTLLGNVRTSLVTVPMPDPAVGVGARWQMQRVHQIGRIQTTQTVVYTLHERKDRVLRLGVTLQQSAAPQEVQFDDGTVLKVESYEVSGTGSMIMNLDAITPLGELRGNSDLRGIVRRGDQSEPLRLSGALQLVIAPVSEAPDTKAPPG
jgi:hypothetical protein